jgi:hypothetical protein
MSRNTISEPANFEMPEINHPIENNHPIEINHPIENQRAISPKYRLLAGFLGTLGVGLSVSPLFAPQGAVAFGIAGFFGLATAVTGRNLVIESGDALLRLRNRGRDRELEYRDLTEHRDLTREADHENQPLEELLAAANQLSVAAANTAVNVNFIRDAIESDISIHRLSAIKFISFLPNDVTENQLTSLASSYYNNSQRDQDAQLIIAENQRENFNQSLRFFRDNCITTPAGVQSSFGRINDARISQAIFFSSIVAIMKNPSNFLNAETEEGSSIKKIEEIEAISKRNPNTVTLIEEALNRHLLNIYNDMAREGSEDGKIAVLYGYKFAKNGDIRAIGGGEVSSANSITLTATTSEPTTAPATGQDVTLVRNPVATQLSQIPYHQIGYQP